MDLVKLKKFNDLCDKVYDDICKTWDKSKRPVSIYGLLVEHSIPESLMDDVVYQLTARRATVRYSSGGLKPEYAYKK